MVVFEGCDGYKVKIHAVRFKFITFPNLTNILRFVELSFASGSSSVVERDLAKVEVASSNLVSRSKVFEDER